MKQMNSNCTGMDAKLANLLLDPASVSAEVQAHVDGCARCSRDLDELRATMALMDAWEAPEPNPYFLTRLEARQREVEPEGWLAKLKASFVYGSHAHVRPLTSMALALVLLVGGGTYLGVTNWVQPPAAPEATAVVHDLQTMDSNAQLLDQLEALSNNVDDDSDNSN